MLLYIGTYRGHKRILTFGPDSEKEKVLEELTKYCSWCKDVTSVTFEDFFKGTEDIQERLERLVEVAGISIEEYGKSGERFFVSISWGDWKHDHIWCDNLITSILGLKLDNAVVTEEDGSDCYSAMRFYKCA